MKKYLGLSLAVILIDQATKYAVVQRFSEAGMGETITSYFNLVRVHNHGAAFSFLSQAGGWQRWFFTALALLVSALIVWMLRDASAKPRYRFGLSLVLGGALGNVIDRLYYGYVVDFLDFHWDAIAFLFPGGHYPAFNVADSAITLGAILLISAELFGQRKQPD